MKHMKAVTLQFPLRILQYIIGILLLVSLAGCTRSAPKEDNRTIFIAHGLGMVDGIGISNSLEAFNFNYNRGFRIFETDLLFTSDGGLVGAHDNMEDQLGFTKPFTQMTRDEYLNARVRGKLTTQSIENILDLLRTHPDTILIIDTKEDIERSFRVLVPAAQSIDQNLLQRIVPQIYQPEDVATLERIHHFDKLIFTLYRSNLSDEAILQFVEKTPQIYAISMSTDRFSANLAAQLRAHGVHAFVHTLNDEKVINDYINQGATGVYTDSFFRNIQFPGDSLPSLAPSSVIKQ